MTNRLRLEGRCELQRSGSARGEGRCGKQEGDGAALACGCGGWSDVSARAAAAVRELERFTHLCAPPPLTTPKKAVVATAFLFAAVVA